MKANSVAGLNLHRSATAGIAGGCRKSLKGAEYEVIKHDAQASVSEWRRRKPRLSLRVLLGKTAQPCWFAPAALMVYEIELGGAET